MNFHFDWNINWAQVLQKMLTIILILFVAYLTYYVIKVIIKRALQQLQKKGKKQAHRLSTIRTLITNIVLYVIIFITMIAILSEFNIDATGILASAGVLGLAIGFGAKDLVSDVVTGFFSLMEEQVDVGEYVTVNGYTGVVEEVGLRVLRIRSANGDLHFISNRQIFTVTNHSRGSMQALVDLTLPIKVNVDEAIKKLQVICEEWKKNHDDLVDGPDVIGVQTIGTEDYVIRILAKTKNGKQGQVERALQKEILQLKLDNETTL